MCKPPKVTLFIDSHVLRVFEETPVLLHSLALQGLLDIPPALSWLWLRMADGQSGVSALGEKAALASLLDRYKAGHNPQLVRFVDALSRARRVECVLGVFAVVGENSTFRLTVQLFREGKVRLGQEMEIQAYSIGASVITFRRCR